MLQELCPLTVRSCRNLLVFTGIFTFLVSRAIEPRPPTAAQGLALGCADRLGAYERFGANDETQVDAYPLYAASALAANAFVRCLFAGGLIADASRLAENLTGMPTTLAAFPLFGNQMYDKLGYQWASSLLGFLTLAMLPFPYLFFRYGKKTRGNSRFATD
jgi:hypothetical protein